MANFPRRFFIVKFRQTFEVELGGASFTILFENEDNQKKVNHFIKKHLQRKWKTNTLLLRS